MLREVPLKVFESFYKKPPNDEFPRGERVVFRQSWATMLLNILDAPNPMAQTSAGMRQNMKIQDAIENAEAANAKVVKLEEHLWHHLKNVLASQTFVAPNRDFIALEDGVIAAPSIDPNAAP